MPSLNTTITRTELGSTFREFDQRMGRMGYVTHKILTPAMVGVQSADVPLIDRKNLKKNETGNTLRGPSATYRRLRSEVGKFSFQTEEHGVEYPIDDRMSSIYSSVFDSEQIASDVAEEVLLTEFEVDGVAALTATGTFANAGVVNGTWNVSGTATPIIDCRARIEAYEARTGMNVDVMVVGVDNYREMIDTDNVLNRIKYWGGDDPKFLSTAAIADILQIGTVLVAGVPPSLKNAAGEGQAVSLSRIWPHGTIGFYSVAQSRNLGEMCVGRTIMYGPENAGLGTDEGLVLISEQYRSEEVRSDVIRRRMDYQQKIIYAGAGELLTGA
jgi:hypothetical protein